MENFDDREPWEVAADRLHERSSQFHEAALQFLKKAGADHLNVAVALRCSEEGRKLDQDLLKVIYPHKNLPLTQRSKPRKPPLSPTLSDELLDALFEPEENEYAQMDARSATETGRADSALETLGTQHGGKDSPRQADKSPERDQTRVYSQNSHTARTH